MVEFPISGIFSGHVHVLKKSANQTTLHQLQLGISENIQAVNLQRYRFMSNVNFVNSAEDLGKKEVVSQLVNAMPSHSHIVWTTEHYSLSHLMNQVFPVQSILPSSAWLTGTKSLLIDGTSSQEYIFPKVGIVEFTEDDSFVSRSYKS
ncbi:hypothetical protein PoB_002775300 [Plakobranchus ocellatus]|uniref:Uncharacterized protein n=1 Tax=Plakobranchus ocellatus TaxID=259542 RepID=A0AAV4A3L0_9GAST|nr:hypothetical protein PoB_002775300 [Plakobranchus ocellatus]